MNHQPIGLYLHIPFCRSKCPYCDFCSYPRPTKELMEAYTHELARRIREAGKTYGEKLPEPTSHSDQGTTSSRVALDTVYFGGGTPTLLPPSCVRELFAAIRETFAILPDAEITVEGNPAAASRDALSVWHECGVNRLSLGSQSAQADELKALGRLHRWEDVEKTVADARAVGIENINLDFMLGIPHQTPASLSDTLARALSLEPTHLSAYTLMLEEGTPFHRRGRAGLGLPADEEEADDRAITLWEQASASLRGAGYEHYEISNFAKAGFRSRHNLHTWQCRDYLGLGVAAHSCMNSVRFGQSRDLEGFLRGEDITEFTESLTLSDRESEFIMLSLRLSDGLDEGEFLRRFGRDFWHTHGDACIPYIEMGLMRREGGRVFLTEGGFPVSNAILADLI
ncbi:MAG: radical SAM family heme chaperone HemW [Clostridia bacterium]|nr:radical SAM family heme chaperone HemW [Clostridia bacterium]